MLIAFVLVGLLGFFDPKTDTVRASGGGYDLEVTYAERSRAGLATPWTLKVHKPGGFDDKPITVAMTSSYFDLYDENGLDPDPAKSTSTNSDTIWEFDPPPGDTLTVSFDARMQPDRQAGEKATASVLEHDQPVATVQFQTRAIP